MKLKLAIIGLIMLGNTACVTSTNSYTRDIVYRDGSYYSPADDQNGDYYYEPEPQYDEYEYNYGFGSSFYGNPWYSHHDAYRCRFIYRYDRYCDNGWGSISLNFGGISLIFGNSRYYDVGYGYGYPYYGYYNPHYGYYSPRPRPNNDPIPVRKPFRPAIQIPDNSVSNRPSIRVRGEPTRVPTKPGVLEPDTIEPVVESSAGQDLNPYTRIREPRQNRRPEIWRDRDPAQVDQDDGIQIGNNEAPRSWAKPMPVMDTDSDNQTYENPAPRQRQPLPYPVYGEPTVAAEPAAVPAVQARTRPERAERTERTERPARAERVERVERSAPAVREESGDRGKEEQ